ncbi:MAG TPA: hypothetical protein VLA19_27825 [Herpetosiphonaceae bacterium]|nr:hypothetical protein [Herpetosiphonaceae bacterium]
MLWSQRRTLGALDAVIERIEYQIDWTDAQSARMAKVGRLKDSAYAKALLERGRSHLELLRQCRQELLSQEQPRQKGGAPFSSLLGGGFRGWDRPGRR